MSLDDPTEQLRFRLGVGLLALTLLPVLTWFVRLADGDFSFGPAAWLMSVAGLVSALVGAVLAGRGMPSAVGPNGWRRLGVGAAVAAVGVTLLLSVQNMAGI